MRVLIACEHSQRIQSQFQELGHDTWSCDLLPCEGPNPHRHIQDDIRNVLATFPGISGPVAMPYTLPNGVTTWADNWDLMIAHPECTRLSNSGVQWLSKPPKGKTVEGMWAELLEGVALYTFLRDAPIVRKAIENPVMHCYAKDLIKPGKRQIVQPWWFGDPFFKATGFELIGLPPLVATNKLTPPAKGTDEHKAWSAVHRASPGPNRWKERSLTYPGLARAIAQQWGSANGMPLHQPLRRTS